MALYTIHLNRAHVRDWLNDTVADLAAQAKKDGRPEKVTTTAESRVWDEFPGAIAETLKNRRPDDEFAVTYQSDESARDMVSSGDGDPDAVFSDLDEAWEEVSGAIWFDDADFEPAAPEPV